MAACAWYGPSRSRASAGLQRGDTLGDEHLVPPASILFRQRHQGTVRGGPGLAAGVVQQHQREQAGDLRIVDRRVQLPRETDRLRGQIDVAGVPLVEDEIEHMHDGRQVTRLVELDLAHRSLRPADALGHRRLRHEVGARDLRSRQPAECAEGQRHRRCRCQGGMGAQEVQPECVVDARHGARPRFRGDAAFPPAPRRLGTGAIDERVPGSRDQPALGIAGWIVGPRPERLDQRVLDGVLGGGEVRAAPNEDLQHLRCQLAKHLGVDVRIHD